MAASNLGLRGQRGRTFVVVLCIGASLALVAAASAKTPTHASFVKAADAICVKAAAEAKGLAPPTTLGEGASYVSSTIAILQRIRSTTLALPAPAADKPARLAGMNALGKEVAVLRKARLAAIAGDLKLYKADLATASPYGLLAAKFAKKLGLKACGG